MSTTPPDPRVTAIRADKIVGKFSCSFIDECYTDSELTKQLDEDGIKTPKKSVTWARRLNCIFKDRESDLSF